MEHTAPTDFTTGDPVDDAEDQSWPVWAGVMPTKWNQGTPTPGGYVKDRFAPPAMLLP